MQELSRETKGLIPRHQSLARTSRDAERTPRGKLNQMQDGQVRGLDVQVDGERRRGGGSAGWCVDACVAPPDYCVTGS